MALDSEIQAREDLNNEPFVLEDGAEVIDGITLAASQGALTIGAVLGEVSATPGTYKLCDYTAQDGSNIPKLILAVADVPDSGSPTTNLSAYRIGLFDERLLVFAAGTDLGSRLDDELMPNLVDRDFSGPSAWANVDINSYDETGDLSIVASAAAQYCTLPVASFPTVIGKTYKLALDVAGIVSDWDVRDFSGAQLIGNIAANGTQVIITWLAQTTGGLRIVAGENDSAADLDNFTLSLSGENTDLSMRQLLRQFGILLAPGTSESGFENPAA